MHNVKILLIFSCLIYACQSKPKHYSEVEACHSLPADNEINSSQDIFSLPQTITVIGTQTPDNLSKNYQITNKPKIPKGMILVNGGLTKIGSENGLFLEQPTFWISVKPFFMDISPVTVAEFARFVKVTNYVTEAEKFGNAGIINESTHHKWFLKEGANWRYPQGKEASPAKANHPVTQVSWNDALAYCKWAKKRLPSELEWEHAARNARNDTSIYPFGNEIKENITFKANVWQGQFPFENLKSDSFAFTSPVGYFGKTPLGLTDMTGNVWEWCQDNKQSYQDIIDGVGVTKSSEKVMRGGSFLCEPNYCHGYRVSARSFSDKETSLFHVGFRCVKDID